MRNNSNLIFNCYIQSIRKFGQSSVPNKDNTHCAIVYLQIAVVVDVLLAATAAKPLSCRNPYSCSCSWIVQKKKGPPTYLFRFYPLHIKSLLNL